MSAPGADDTWPLRWGQGGLPDAPQRMLLVQISAMGDQVQTLAAVSDIAARWPQLQIDWAVDSRFAQIPELHPRVRHVFALPLKALQRAPGDGAAWRALLGALRGLRAQRYDVVWDPHGSLKSALVARAARSALRVGYRAADCGGEPLAARAYRLHFARPPGVHGTEGRRRFAAAVFDTDPARPIDYGIRDAFGTACAARYAVLAHGASKPEKLWPQANWKQLGDGLIALGLQLVLPWGNEAERARAAALVAAWPAGSARLAEPGDLRSMAALLAGSSLVVGLDTGFSHLAGAMRRPLVMLFTSTGADLFSAEDLQLARTLGGNGTVPTPEAALDAARQLLGAGRAAG